MNQIIKVLNTVKMRDARKALYWSTAGVMCIYAYKALGKDVMEYGYSLKIKIAGIVDIQLVKNDSIDDDQVIDVVPNYSV